MRNGAKSQLRIRGLTLVEVAVVLAVIGAGMLAFATAHSALSEDARAAKCLSNLKRGMQAILEYTIEFDGVLPGPVHPVIYREIGDSLSPASDVDHSLAWLLGPFLAPDDPAVGDPNLSNRTADEVFRCPTAALISPDREFTSASCYTPKAYNYVCNSFGVLASPGAPVPSSNTFFYQTDPPNYFGAWYLCDPTPVRPDVSWRPKRIDSIRNASSEWALADAWYRRISSGGSRGGTTIRLAIGSMPVGSSFPVIPSAPYHHVDIRVAKSHWTQNAVTLPNIPLEGETNQAYFDGHVASFVGSWDSLGQGGTVNPYWQRFSGDHPQDEPWYP